MGTSVVGEIFKSIALFTSVGFIYNELWKDEWLFPRHEFSQSSRLF